MSGQQILDLKFFRRWCWLNELKTSPYSTQFFLGHKIVATKIQGRELTEDWIAVQSLVASALNIEKWKLGQFHMFALCCGRASGHFGRRTMKDTLQKNNISVCSPHVFVWFPGFGTKINM